MSSIDKHTSAPYANARGFSFVELLVASAIIMVFLGGILTAFIQILRATDLAEIRMEAVNNARAALDTMSDEIKEAYVVAPPFIAFAGINNPLSFGDRVDNDKDGAVDEEQIDGFDDPTDSDWNVTNDDRDEVIITTTVSVEKGAGVDDLGDGHVDEDVVFNEDRLWFTVQDLPSGRVDQIVYYIDTFEGIENVLIREHIKNVFLVRPEITFSPIAFNVLSINFLYWDPNVEPKQWVEEWESSEISGFIPNSALLKMEFPTSVYITITIDASGDPIDLTGNEPFDVITLSTMVNIEQMLQDSRYKAMRNRE